MKKERNYNLDILRCIACLMVILMHSPKPQIGLSGIVCSGTSLLCEPCIGLFFMISGALLLPTNLPFFEFVKKRFAKIIPPTLIFSLFYIGVNFFCDGLSLAQVWHAVSSIPFSSQGHGVLWFMYTLLGLYLVTPIISPFLKISTKNEVLIILILWMVTMCWPLLECFVTVNETVTSMLYIFRGYTGYFLLGYYLNKYPIKCNICILGLLLILPMIAYLITKIYEIDVYFYSVFWYLSILGAMSCFAWWQLVVQFVHPERIPERLKLILIDFSSCGMGIYLIHIFIMRRIIWELSFLDTLPPILHLLITFVATTLLSWGFAHIVSRTSLGSYIIGYQRKH